MNTSIHSKIAHQLISIFREVGRFALPSYCTICDNEVDTPGICYECWPQLNLITDNACLHCGSRFEYRSPLVTCGDCLRDPPDFDDAIATAAYSGIMKDMVIALKHGDRLDIAPVLAKIMAPKMLPLLNEADFILPLPLHRRRFFKRRFNQSAELARHLMIFGNISMDKLNTRILIRHKSTSPQGHKSKSQRISAMRGAFSVPDDQIEMINDKHIIIIDDVMTTGASLSSAARALKKKGAKRVSACVAARVC